jgi:chromosomal replication initiation ATPase DnaA
MNYTPRYNIPPQQIADICAKVYELPVEVLYTKTHKGIIPECRGMCLFFIFKHLGYSKTDTGLIFKMPETSARYWIQNIPDFAKFDKPLKSRFIEVGHELGITDEWITRYLAGK